ncbi:hypothetical protein EAI89_09385 [Eubacterium sp. am_0171]|nr:hypothetical protein EAI89_09385 [Eubacterium sp. am_0171]
MQDAFSLSRLSNRTGSPVGSSYVGFHFDEAAVIPERRIQKTPATIPDSCCIRPAVKTPLLPEAVLKRELRICNGGT